MSTLQKSTINGVHFGPIKKIDLAPDNQHLLSLGSTDGIINVIDFDKFDVSPDFNTASITTDQIYTFSTIEKKKSFIITDDGKQLLNINWPDISQTTKITETDMQMTVLATNSDGNIVALSGEDPQITIINIDNPDEQTQLFDNLKAVVYIGFGPVCQTLVIINEDGEILTYSASSSYQEYKIQKINIKTVFPGVCWSDDSQLLISDSEKKGVFHAFHFSSEGYAKGRFQNLGIIAALSISKSFLLAACDSSQKIVIAQYSENFIQNQQLPILHIFDPKIQAVSTLFWFENYLIAGDSEGSIHKWDRVEAENTKEIEVVPSVLESDKEIEEIYSESENSETEKISKERHIIRSGKHRAEIPRSHQKQKSAESTDKEEQYSDEEEEDEEEYRRNKNPYIIDEASEASSDYESDSRPSRTRPNYPEYKQKLTADDLAERIKQNLNIKEYSTTPTVTESEPESEDPNKPLSKEEVRARKEQERLEARLDRQFIVNSGSEVSEEGADEAEEEEEAIEAVTDSEEDIPEADDNEPIQFMPGSTDDFENKRRFLCFNLIAKIFLRENADESTSIDVEYSDRKYRSVYFENKERYILATVNSSGVTLASRSRVYYKPHQPWSTDCECQIKMENDEFIDLIASGNDWFAVTTNLKRLRVFMASGLEIAIIAIPQRPMTMAGGGDHLFIAFGEKYNDDLTFQLIDVKKRRLLTKNLLPISKIVNWVGYDDGTFYILGNNHILYALVNDFGYTFMPVCNVYPKNQKDENGNENELSEFWAVGVSHMQLCGVFLPPGRKFPEPVRNLKLDVLDIEPQSADDESRDYLLRRIAYCNSSKSGKEENATKMDKELLKMFAQAIKNKEYQKMLHIGLQITSKKGKEYTLSIIKQKGEEFEDLANQLQEFWNLNLPNNEEEEEENQNQEDEEVINNNDYNEENQNQEVEEVINNNDENQNIEVVEETEIITQNLSDGELDSAVVREIVHDEAQNVDDDEDIEKEQSNDDIGNSGKEDSVNNNSDEGADSVEENDDDDSLVE